MNKKIYQQHSRTSDYFKGFNTKLQFNHKNFLQTNLQTPVNIQLLHNAVDFCAQQIFGVELMTNGTWSAKGQNGEMKFKVLKGTEVPVSGRIGPTKHAKTFSVYNDATTYSLATLGSLGKGGGGSIGRGIYL